ncbi:MAG TPA: selenocysteine-specific translation elongation factor [Candidatus Binatia bacterium]|nr:selenocysteine-specific translation elongation factor [Candidatus Binatia bacterium]
MHFIVGTAGHIDHGKTALVKALTGQDTDRLKEEKERGISIDLGFAELTLPDGAHAGVVDVPGHERFIKNMLAGAHGIDLVLFVVAADDGVMPQTEEHLDILHLLGVSTGIVVITKADLVDAARLAAVREEIEILTVDTALEGAPVVAVSSVTGDGIEALRAQIMRSLPQGSAQRGEKPFRLPVDRAFVMKGHGVVVTGTAVAGRVATGDAVRILPGGEQARVRTVQVHGHEVGAAERGQRVALNLVGVERTDVVRGHVVVDPSITATTDRIDARVEIRPLAKKPLPNRRRVRLHIGTAEVMARLVLLGGRTQLAPKQSAFAQLVCEDPVVAFRGDRFIVRSESAERTLGGGVVIHPVPPRHRAADPAVPALLERVRSEDLAATVLALLEMDREFARAPSWLAQAAGVSEGEIVGVAAHPGLAVLPGSAALEALTTRAKWERWLQSLLDTLGAHHRARPLLPGMEMELLRAQLPDEVPAKLFRAIVDRLAGEKTIIREDSSLRLPTHVVKLASAERAATGDIEALLEKGGYTPADVKQIGETLKLPGKRVTELLQALEREAKAVKVAQDLYYHTSVMARLREMIGERIRLAGPLGAAEFRDMIGASRKFSIALLEYFDRTGFTIRVGDQRKLRRD